MQPFSTDRMLLAAMPASQTLSWAQGQPLSHWPSGDYIVVLKSDSEAGEVTKTHGLIDSARPQRSWGDVEPGDPDDNPIATLRGKTDENGSARLSFTINAKRNGYGVFAVCASASKSGFSSGSASTTFTVVR